MTREEQIMNDPNLSAYTDKQRGWINEAFMDGVRWADKTMIDKACKWMEEYLFELGFPDDWLRDSPNIMNGEQRFRKAMEEE